MHFFHFSNKSIKLHLPIHRPPLVFQVCYALLLLPYDFFKKLNNHSHLGPVNPEVCSKPYKTVFYLSMAKYSPIYSCMVQSSIPDCLAIWLYTPLYKTFLFQTIKDKYSPYCFIVCSLIWSGINSRITLALAILVLTIEQF